MELWAVIVLGYSRHPVDAASNLSNHENFERRRIFTASGVCFGGIDLFPSSRVERQKFKVSSLNLFSFFYILCKRMGYFETFTRNVHSWNNSFRKRLKKI